MVTRILLGLDFIGANFPAALYSIQRWWEYVNESREYVCTLGISNFCDRHSALPGARCLTPAQVREAVSSFVPADQVILWTSDLDAAFLERVKANGCRSKPFYPGFSYGSVDNRLLLLAHSCDCDYLVRIDPGTLPPRNVQATPPAETKFIDVMKEHQEKIAGNPATVVSRRYNDRLALRNMFVAEGKEDEHAKAVKEFTGINVFHQITGGAMLTFKTPGTPAVCLPAEKNTATLVWASDDGVFQVLDETRKTSDMFEGEMCRVMRFDAQGKPKSPTEYYRGIVGAAYCYALRRTWDERGTWDVAGARTAITEFLGKLKNGILDPEKCAELYKDDCVKKIAPDESLKAIADGIENHARLLEEWPKICEVLKPSIIRETSANAQPVRTGVA